MLCVTALSEQASGPVVVIRIDDGVLGSGGMIDNWLARFIERKLASAKSMGAKAVIFEIDTGGGQVGAALEVCEKIVKVEVPTAAFIRNKAYSAGALLALSCKKIYMEPTAVIGAAFPYQMGPQGVMEVPEKVEEKFVRSVDAKFKAVAEAVGHSTALAQAMVDPKYEVIWAEVDGERRIVLREEFQALLVEENHETVVEVGTPINPAGEILVLTAKGAAELGLAEGVVKSQAEVVQALGFEGAAVEPMQADWAEELARVIAGPLLSGLLIMLAIVGLAVELKTPGFGVGGAVFVIALSLFFWGQFVAGAADALDILLFLAGFVLLAIELLLIPGFGVIGISGLVLMGASLILTYVPSSFWGFDFEENPWRLQALWGGLTALVIPVTAGILIDFIIIAKAESLPFLKRFVLSTQSDAALIPAAASGQAAVTLVGREGAATTDLRPAGRAEIDGEPFDVVTEGDFIEAGVRVRVVKVEATRIIVEEA